MGNRVTAALTSSSRARGCAWPCLLRSGPSTCGRRFSADGPRVLKRFLEYAETRGRAVVESITNEPDSDFEVEVGERLRAKGYELDFQVGVSGYKIDLAVRHPDHAERFLAGIDATAPVTIPARAPRPRPAAGRGACGLGWTILRVWSTDWFDNPELETDKLVANWRICVRGRRAPSPITRLWTRLAEVNLIPSSRIQSTAPRERPTSLKG